MVVAPNPRRARRLGRLAIKSALPRRLGRLAIKSALPRRLGRLALELTLEVPYA